MGMSSTPKPAVGSFAECATCGKQFTVTKYTMASSSDPGFLCHPCAKAGGNDPFKKPAAPRKRKTPAERRTVVHIEERSFPTLVSICIDVIARHIDDVEAFGDIGALNMDAISKALSKNRSLNSENATLFYGAENTKLALYDATNLAPDGFSTLGHLNPNLTSLRLDFCGPLNDTVMASWNNSFPNLVSLELLGPFLVREAAWTAFLKSHPNLEAFLITQSPRFSLDCLTTLIDNSKNDPPPSRSARELTNLTYLDLAEPSDSLTDDAAIALLAAVGANLTHLDLSGHSALTDDFLAHGIDTHMHTLASLALTHLPELTDAGLAASARTPSRRVVAHSGMALQELNINGWKDVGQEVLNQLAGCRDLRRLDVGWCREVDDWVVKRIVEGCRALVELKVWGCNRVEGKWGETRRGVRIHGIESQSVV
ncbi:hypothetical protein B0H14DRAFT_3106798 [Mycena olivaceomarginata]|nr:hypothetical protein B0H14DRAFT_3106798 [Mycena olivaceomarginata]